MTDFRELSDYEIDQLDDTRLLAYIASARASSEGAALRAVQHLIFRHMDSVSARVRRKIPAHLVEDVAAEALIEAIASVFSGATIKEFHKWLNVIVQRTIADFYRGPRGRQLELDREVRVDEEGEPVLREPGEEGGYGEAEVQQIVDSVMAARSAEHQRVVEMLVWGGYSAREAAEATGLSEDNCYQVVRRFRVDLRAALDGDTGGGS